MPLHTRPQDVSAGRPREEVELLRRDRTHGPLGRGAEKRDCHRLVGHGEDPVQRVHLLVNAGQPPPRSTHDCTIFFI
eukprot:792910-Lingulodinium_polyedra.AAC.1